MKISILLMSLIASASLQANQASDNLSVNIGGDVPALLIPATTYSCMEIASGNLQGQGEIKKNYFRFPNPDIKWAGDKNSNIYIDMIRLTMSSPEMGQYQCIHSGTQLGSLFYKYYTSADGKIYSSFWDRTLGLNSFMSTKDIVTSGFHKCDMICGGVTLAEGSGKFTVDGQWEVFGVERKYSSSNDVIEENPIYKKGNFKVSNVVETN